MFSRRATILGALSLLSLVASLPACSAEGAVADPASSAEEAAQAVSEEGREAPPEMRHGRPGPEGLLFAALRDLELTAEQKNAIQSAADSLGPRPKGHPKMGPPPSAAVAQGVRAGHIDEAAVRKEVESFHDAAQPQRDALEKALVTLHTTLTPEQRKTLVDGMVARMDEHGMRGKHGEPGERGMQGERGEHAERGGPPGEHGPGRHGPPGEHGPGRHGPPGEHGPGAKAHGGPSGGPLGHLLSQLDLTEAQQGQVHEALEAKKPAEADREQMRQGKEAHMAQMRARLEAFAGASFDAGAFLEKPKDGKGPEAHLGRMVEAFNAVLPILTQDQREELATMLEQGPPGPPDAPPME